jgi:hypothetical protein
MGLKKEPPPVDKARDRQGAPATMQFNSRTGCWAGFEEDNTYD